LVAAQDPAPRARLRLARPHRPLHRLRPAVAAWGRAGQGHPAVRARRVHRAGPYKLAAYRWNLVERFAAELVFIVAEVDLTVRTAQLRLKAGFEVEALGARPLVDGLIHAEPAFRVSTAVLEHGTPCLAFAVEETAHVNVWKNRLAELGLPVGPWLRSLKRALLEGRPDDYPIEIAAEAKAANPRTAPLGALRPTATVSPGQKIGYVTDVAD